MADLLFRDPATSSSPADLRFNETYSGNIPARVEGVVPGLTGAVILADEPMDAEVSGVMPGLTAVVELNVGLPTPEYLTARAAAPWREATDADGRAGGGWSDAEKVQATSVLPWVESTRLGAAWGSPWRDTAHLGAYSGPLPWKDAGRLTTHTREPWRDTTPVAVYGQRLPWREAAGVRIVVREPWRDAAPVLVAVIEAWRQGQPNQGQHRFPWQRGNANTAATREPWRDALLLESHGGPRVIVVPPEPEPCYVPSGTLLFLQPAATNGDLLFVCEAEDDTEPPPALVVIPIRKVYTVLNTFTLRRVDNDEYIAAVSCTMTLDADSYTWSFSATVPDGERPKVEPDLSGAPVEVEATVNGVAYRFLIDKIGRDRQHGSFTMSRISGRGLGMALDLLQGNFSNDEIRTAAQLMDDALSVNGVGIGWTVDWQLDDWSVPAGAWVYRGRTVDALQRIVDAAGGYLQPHPTDKTLLALHRYPVAPWEWDTVTPDYEIPTSVVTSEGTEWVEKPRYTRAFITAESQGVIAQVTRDGASEILVAPLVVHPLISELSTGAQKARAVLGDTGRIAKTSLSLPVLPETGIIPPGKMIRYTEGLAERLGITRAVSVSITESRTRQTLEVEIHE